jgi:hypothetical protein
MTSLVLSTVTRAQSTHQIGGCSIESGGEEFPAVLEFLSYAGHRSGPANHQCLGELCSASRFGLLRLLRRGKHYRHQQRVEVETEIISIALFSGL